MQVQVEVEEVEEKVEEKVEVEVEVEVEEGEKAMRRGRGMTEQEIRVGPINLLTLTEIIVKLTGKIVDYLVPKSSLQWAGLEGEAVSEYRHLIKRVAARTAGTVRARVMIVISCHRSAKLRE